MACTNGSGPRVGVICKFFRHMARGVRFGKPFNSLMNQRIVVEAGRPHV